MGVDVNLQKFNFNFRPDYFFWGPKRDFAADLLLKYVFDQIRTELGHPGGNAPYYRMLGYVGWIAGIFLSQ